ncbi:YtxH domain-containing protein [Parapedobacter sp. 10938]|uniref:YtxH domain-containing protein n=1 Tax=Parapedobacter flavus TaxID=3110225 RepID=UPI002DBD4EB0|nr:YtxH domain-containing protein [Parapedobacter sp. 10938]MEC3878550.1 YtxH domain-containing protein [Parapedobacter sp. 10938]
MLFIPYNNSKQKRNRKEMEMNTKNSIVTYALVGLAAGTVAWLLLGTKEGRKQMDRASDGIRELSKSVRKTTKEGIRKASEIANRATEEIDALRSQAKNKGEAAVKKADRMAKSGVDKARNTVKAAKRRAEEEI